MKVMYISLQVLSIAAVATAQSPFEPSDFNITQALINNGVNASLIQDISALHRISLPNPCPIACKIINAIFGEDNVLEHNDPAYELFTQSYWAQQQAQLNPTCIFKPKGAQAVSTLVLLSRLTQCRFAVKSGGHATFAGASSIENGITVSFEKMKQIALSEDKSSVDVEPGNLWHDVYTALEKHDVTVIGGRVKRIGIGGLLLGGGISYFSNTHGWACDNILSYTLITAAGIQLTASHDSHPNLFWALRGGGNNFGIVTSFRLSTIPLPQGKMWGGPRQYLEPAFPALITAFYNLGVNSKEDTKAAQILSFAYFNATKVALAELEYSEPFTRPTPQILTEYLDIPVLAENSSVRTLAELTELVDQVQMYGSRQVYWPATFVLDVELVERLVEIYYEEVLSVADVQGSILALSLQVITETQIEKMGANGGNPLGLSDEKGPLLLLQCSSPWTDEADDERMLSVCPRIYERAREEAGPKGLARDYVYMNYASPYQAVIPSYGKENQERLKAVAREYDPTGVFQKLQPGHFKLDGAPYGELL